MSTETQVVAPKTLVEWHTPKSRTEGMEALIHSVDRYNPGNLPMMEDYLRDQMEQGEHDMLVNLAILKLYQFNPQLSNPEIIVHILTQALASTVHGPDFGLCLSLLREPSFKAILQDTDGDEGDGALELVMPWLQSLHEQVRTCQFSKFWAEFNGSSEAAQVYRETYLPRHPYLVSALRRLFATSISSCFSNVSITHLQKWLDLPENEVKDWCESVGWKVDGAVAVVPKNGDNDVKAGVVKENVQLSQLTKLVAAAAY